MGVVGHSVCGNKIHTRKITDGGKRPPGWGFSSARDNIIIIIIGVFYFINRISPFSVVVVVVGINEARLRVFSENIPRNNYYIFNDTI